MKRNQITSPFLEKIERYNRKLIPGALILLLAIIALELFVQIENHTLELAMKILDGIIIAIFVVDLIFLAIHSKNTRFFFRNYWLDILAVFPFAVVFNVVEEIYRGIAAAERIVIGQAVFHEGLEAEKLLKEGAKEGKLVRIVRAIPRGLRFISKSHYFESFRNKRNKNEQKD